MEKDICWLVSLQKNICRLVSFQKRYLLVGVLSKQLIQGAWTCRLEDNDFDSDSLSFNVEYLKKAQVSLTRGSVTRDGYEVKEEKNGGRRKRNTPQGVNLQPEDTMEMTCKADKAFPSSTITWYLGPSNPVNFNSPKFKGAFELISETGPSQIGGTFTSSQTVRYTARRQDNQISVYCEATQVDDENNEEKTGSSQRFTLYVRPAPLPPQAPVNAAMIGSIIGFIIILLLAILLLLLAWKTKKFCFKESEKYVVKEPLYEPPMCPGCRDTTGLLKEHLHTCEMATQKEGPDDHVNKVTKYQTEIILVSDKLVGNPTSEKHKEDFGLLTQNLEGLMRGMADSETDDGLKNRFLMAAQGLTSSMDALLGAAEKTGANPHSEAERRKAREAGEEMKSTVTQSVNTVRRIHAMKDLQRMAEAAISATKETNDVATEVTENDPASHDSFTEACGEAAHARSILEQALNYYIQNPTSARAQNNLLLASKGFLQPAEVGLEKCYETTPELAFEASQEKLKESAEKLSGVVKSLKSTVYDTELCVDSLATEEAAEELRSLKDQLEIVKAEAAKGNLRLQPGESSDKASADLVHLCSTMRALGAECLISSLNGDKLGMDKIAGELLDAANQLSLSTKVAAAGAEDKSKQEMLLNSGLAVLDQAAEVLTTGRRTVLNPSNPVSAAKQILAGEGLSQALTSSTLASSVHGNLKATPLVTEDLNRELEQFRAAVDAFQVKPVPGVLLENVSSKLDEATGKVERSVADLVGSATRGDDFGSQEAAYYTALALDDYKSAVKSVVSIVTDKEVQENVLDKGQTVLGGASQLVTAAEMVLAQPGNAEAGRRLQTSAANLTHAMKGLEQAYMYGAPGQKQFVTALNIMKNATKELQNPTPTDKKEDIGQLKTRMMTATKEIAGLAHDIQTTAHTDPEEMDGLTTLAQKYKNLASDINQLLEQAEDEEEGRGTLDTVSGLGKSILHLIEGAAGHQIRPGQTALLQIANEAQEVAANSVKTLSSVNNLAKRAQAMDIIAKHLAGVLHNLDTTIMFASAGTLNIEDEQDTFARNREDILKYAQVLVTDVQAVLSGSASAKGELIVAGEKSLVNMQQLAEKIKAAASCLGPENQEAQVMLLNTAKDVCSSLVDLMHHAKAANGQDIRHPAYAQVKTHSKGVINNITSLLKSVKNFEDESSRGSKAMESSVAAIGQELQMFRSGEGSVVVASPEELLRANRAITQATSKAVAAASSGKQEDLLAVANIGRRAIAELLQTCRGAIENCEDTELKADILRKGDLLAQQYQQLLGQVAGGASKETLVESSRLVAQTATALAQLAERLKGSNWVADVDNDIIIAETELLNAAESIEQAALKLSKLIPKHSPEERDLENMTFNELIIDSAQSIAKATSSLIKAATEAQRELVAQGKVAAETEVGSEAGQWSEGLVSAAKLVASATRSLCEAANNLVTGEGGEEHLIAAAKAVSKSTAQLVLACKVKADGWETSSVMMGLNTASIAVRKATDALVKAARGSIDRESNSKVRVDAYKEMIDADARVIRLQKEVSQAKLVEEERKEQSQITGTVSDIKKARDAENEVASLAKELELAVNHKLRLNERQYNTLQVQRQSKS